MNIFYLDNNPKAAASYHCDKHVVKMILESAQLLSTAHRVLDGEEGVKLSSNGRKLKTWILPDWREDIMYSATHVNHPCAIWTRQSSQNYEWLESLFVELCIEYTRRYNKVHLCEVKFSDALVYKPDNLHATGFTEPVQAMPDYCKVVGNSVQAYRNYYINEKRDIAEWRYSAIPYWYKKEETKCLA